MRKFSVNYNCNSKTVISDTNSYHGNGGYNFTGAYLNYGAGEDVLVGQRSILCRRVNMAVIASETFYKCVVDFRYSYLPKVYA